MNWKQSDLFLINDFASITQSRIGNPLKHLGWSILQKKNELISQNDPS